MSRTFDLPWPPSVNTYWRHPNKGPLAGRTLISEKGRKYRADCVALAKTNRWPAFVSEARLSVTIHAYPPDKRRRDLDNVLKAALDVMGLAGVYGDDSQIDRLEIVRKESPGAVLCVSVEQIT
jgi:crossover junction endodeoxyribonuclease RusA